MDLHITFRNPHSEVFCRGSFIFVRLISSGLKLQYFDQNQLKPLILYLFRNILVKHVKPISKMSDNISLAKLPKGKPRKRSKYL